MCRSLNVAGNLMKFNRSSAGSCTCRDRTQGMVSQRAGLGGILGRNLFLGGWEGSGTAVAARIPGSAQGQAGHWGWIPGTVGVQTVAGAFCSFIPFIPLFCWWSLNVLPQLFTFFPVSHELSSLEHRMFFGLCLGDTLVVLCPILLPWWYKPNWIQLPHPDWGGFFSQDEFDKSVIVGLVQYWEILGSCFQLHPISNRKTRLVTMGIKICFFS